ncbi:MAG TPA: DUF4383 domain-containing protein [Aquihabitans sp.]|jgi:hypothetical protein|nr:DUF4383 domain-containing protein [Aquihabitans sp.]
MANAQPLGRSGATRLDAGGRTDRHTTLAQRFALAVGAVFLLVGILGFIPGITSDYGDMAFAGHESHAKLLGIFEVSVLHNLVHLLFGVLGIAAARRHDTARTYLLVGGVIYLALAAYGFIIDHETDANFVPVNRADDWLHTGLGIGMIALGLIGGRDHDDARVGTSNRAGTATG